MSRFVVDSDNLRAVATSLGELSADLDGITASAGLYDASVLGGFPVAQSLQVFDHRWGYGVTEVSGEITDMVVALQTAAGAYERIDRRIERRAHRHVGQGGTGTGTTTIGGPPHHHRPRTGTGRTVIDGRIPPRTAPLSGGVAGASGGAPLAPGHHVPGGPEGAAGPAPIVVHSSLLTHGQETFVARLSMLTGLDPRVVAAWTLSEESSAAAQGRAAQGDNNWLNVGWSAGDHGSMGSDPAWRDPASAAQHTAQFLEGRWGGADPGIRHILSTAGESPDRQLQAITDSDWTSSHFAAAGQPSGTLLHETYAQLSGMTVGQA